jgi:hypothetical protein
LDVFLREAEKVFTEDLRYQSLVVYWSFV